MYKKSSLMSVAMAGAALAMASMSGSAMKITPTSVPSREPRVKYAGARTKKFYRRTLGGKTRHAPAGTKLGREAAKGKIGISRIR